MYGPFIETAKPVLCFDMDTHVAVLLAEIVSAGPVQYLYILTVSEKDGPIVLHVTSERNMMQAFVPESGGGSHFLCTFEGGVHSNYGCSNDWADARKFAVRALRMAIERVGCPIERVRRIEPEPDRPHDVLNS
jgi:hypothetical protein